MDSPLARIGFPSWKRVAMIVLVGGTMVLGAAVTAQDSGGVGAALVWASGVAVVVWLAYIACAQSAVLFADRVEYRNLFRRKVVSLDEVTSFYEKSRASGEGATVTYLFLVVAGKEVRIDASVWGGYQRKGFEGALHSAIDARGSS